LQPSSFSPRPKICTIRPCAFIKTLRTSLSDRLLSFYLLQKSLPQQPLLPALALHPPHPPHLLQITLFEQRSPALTPQLLLGLSPPGMKPLHPGISLYAVYRTAHLEGAKGRLQIAAADRVDRHRTAQHRAQPQMDALQDLPLVLRIDAVQFVAQPVGQAVFVGGDVWGGGRGASWWWPGAADEVQHVHLLG
jgi:hypothetical protein